MENLQPEISIIIPIHHSSQLVADTCESLLSQIDIRWEAIFLDAGLELEASQIIASYQDSRMKVQALTKGSLYAMMNRGLMMAQGQYVNIILEGCTYLAPTSLAVALKKLHELKDPDLFYTASYVGDSQGLEHLYFIADWKNALTQGLQPTLLQSCFFKTQTFKKVGFFHQNLQRRGTLEFFCRLTALKDIRVASEMRVYVVMNLFPIDLLGSWVIFKETLLVIYQYFGLKGALSWLFSKQTTALVRRKYPLDFVITELHPSK